MKHNNKTKNNQLKQEEKNFLFFDKKKTTTFKRRYKVKFKRNTAGESEYSSVHEESQRECSEWLQTSRRPR